MCFQAVEACFRFSAIDREPVFNHAKRFQVQGTHSQPPLSFGRDEPGIFQDPEMLCERRKRHIEWLRELRHRCRAFAQSLNNGPPRWIGESAKGCVDGGVFVRHEPNLGSCLSYVNA